MNQDKFDHDKGQKSAISGRRLHWIFCFFSSICVQFSKTSPLKSGESSEKFRGENRVKSCHVCGCHSFFSAIKKKETRKEFCGTIATSIARARHGKYCCWASDQISFEPGFGAYQGLAQKIKVAFFWFSSFLGDKIQGPSWGQQKRRKPLFGTFWTHVLTPSQGGLSGLRWLKVA